MNGVSKKYEHTEEELKIVKKDIEKELGFEPIETLGYHLAVALYERRKEDSRHEYIDPKTGEAVKSSLLMTETQKEEDKWTQCVGRVIYMGDEAYKTGKFSENNTKPWCKLGDWVVFGRHDGVLISYRGKPVMIIADDRIMARITDKTYVTRY